MIYLFVFAEKILGSPGPKSQGFRVEEDWARVEGAEEQAIQR